MNKTQFIKKLSEQANITQTQSSIAVDILDDRNVFSSSQEDFIVDDIAKALDCSLDNAQEIYDSAKEIIFSEIKHKSVVWIAGTVAVVIAGIIVLRKARKQGVNEEESEDVINNLDKRPKKSPQDKQKQK